MYTYKNKTDQEHVIPNVGLIAPHATFESPIKIENANFEEVEEDK